ncbi:MAG TPA: hypothetical protein VF546_22945 [Pyrinomonadaceae bacterium]|jgi:hypothetical protein
MSLRRYYQTLVVDTDSGRDWCFVSIPNLFSEEDEALGRFRRGNFQLVEISPAALQFAIALLLSADGRLPPDRLRELCVPLTAGALREDRAFAQLEFAQQIVTQPLLLFENSPLEVTSLANLAAEAEFDGEQARVYVATSSESSVLIVKHPRVFVVGGIADTIQSSWKTFIHWLLN